MTYLIRHNANKIINFNNLNKNKNWMHKQSYIQRRKGPKNTKTLIKSKLHIEFLCDKYSTLHTTHLTLFLLQ